MATATALRLSQLGFRVIEGDRGAKVAVLKSPAIAEIFGVRHDNVLRDVRDFQEKLSSNLRTAFTEHCRNSNYRGADNTDRPCFELTKVGFAAIAAKYDATLRFLLALAFDVLEHEDHAGPAERVRQQINQRIRELRSRASGQDEFLFDAPSLTMEPQPAVVPTVCLSPTIIEVEDGDLIDSEARARRIWRRGMTPPAR